MKFPFDYIALSAIPAFFYTLENGKVVEVRHED